MYGKNSKHVALEKKTEIERRTDIVRLLLELRKERLSEDLTGSPSIIIHPKTDQLVAEIQDLKVQNLKMLELLKQLTLNS